MPERCAICDTVIPAASPAMGRQPCPICGNITPRIFDESMTGGVELGGEVIWNLRAGHTDREVTGNDAYRAAREWASQRTREDLLRHPACAQFRSVIEHAPLLSGECPLLWRGRGVDHVPQSAMEMGPPPQSANHGEGRYNKAGESVLYLTDSEDGVHRELSGTPYVQAYHLPLSTIRIADFRVWPADSFVTAVFSIAEECKVEGRGLDTYVFSQTIAEVVAERFDGMLIPGVRGMPGAHYSNVVVFRPHPHWPNWIEPGTCPYLLGSGLPHEHIAVSAYFIWEKDGQLHGRDVAHWYLAIADLNRKRVGSHANRR